MGISYEGFLWGFFDKIRRGTNAIVFQNYTEANVKNGLQFYVQQDWAGVAVGDVVYLGFTTGSKPVIVKSREVSFNGSSKLSYLAYEAAPFTGGTPVTVRNENMIAPVATTVTIANSVTPGTLPVPFRVKTIFGSGATTGGGSRVGTDVLGRETVLKPNTAYLVSLRNLTGSAADIQFELSWYEGTPDLPVA